jgi:glycosyltransferase involved in cell wall biosynthesis
LTQFNPSKVIDAPKASLRVLHFVPRECWPLDTGAKLRNYHLAREVARQCRITLLTFSEQGHDSTSPPATHSENKEQTISQDSIATRQTSVRPETDLPQPVEFYERIVRVARDKGYTLSKVVRGALLSTPLPVLNYTTSMMAKALARVLDEQDFDIVQVESIHLAAYLPIIRAARNRPLVICDWHNIESELMQRYSEHAPGVMRRTYARRTARQLAALERRALLDFDAHVTVSSEEQEKLLKSAPVARIELIENGVDTGYYQEELIARAHADWMTQSRASSDQPKSGGDDSRAGAQKRRVLFVGSMDYHANIDAVTHFAREVWPHVRAQHPDLVFTIVGRDPASEVKQLKSLPGIEVTGTVDDVRPYYYDALMAVIPLRVGGGSRLKILEAMAASVPVVSTRLGAEGIKAEDGVNIVLADTSEDLQRAISSLVKDEKQRRELATGGLALVSAHYGWPRLGARLIDTYQQLLLQRESLSGES